MLDAILGSRTRGKVLMYLVEHGEGYARGMAAELGCALDTVQKQLKRLERGGVAESRTLGQTRVYSLSSDYPLSDELLVLLKAAGRLARSADPQLKPHLDSGAQSRYIVRRIE